MFLVFETLCYGYIEWTGVNNNDEECSKLIKLLSCVFVIDKWP